MPILFTFVSLLLSPVPGTYWELNIDLWNG